MFAAPPYTTYSLLPCPGRWWGPCTPWPRCCTQRTLSPCPRRWWSPCTPCPRCCTQRTLSPCPGRWWGPCTPSAEHNVLSHLVLEGDEVYVPFDPAALLYITYSLSPCPGRWWGPCTPWPRCPPPPRSRLHSAASPKNKKQQSHETIAWKLINGGGLIYPPPTPHTNSTKMYSQIVPHQSSIAGFLGNNHKGTLTIVHPAHRLWSTRSLCGLPHIQYVSHITFFGWTRSILFKYSSG